MKEFRNDDITYDENWQRFDEPSYAVERDVDTPDDLSEINIEKSIKKKKPISLVTIQLVICLIIAFVIFMLRAMDSDYYKILSDWYNEQMKNTLVSSKTFEDIDLSSYFAQTPDELASTVDES